jgi:hypothetical protein
VHESLRELEDSWLLLADLIRVGSKDVLTVTSGLLLKLIKRLGDHGHL